MTTHLRAALALFFVLPVAAGARSAPPPAAKPASTFTRHATGTFEVTVVLLPPTDSTGGGSLGRYSLNKQYHGDLQGTGKGEMLTVMGNKKGSGAYVAVEQVTGTLNGRSGTFTLQHSGSMANGSQQLTITVVPDSGTGQLVGITGMLTITIAPDGSHSYVFDYTLPAAP